MVPVGVSSDVILINIFRMKRTRNLGQVFKLDTV